MHHTVRSECRHSPADKPDRQYVRSPRLGRSAFALRDVCRYNYRFDVPALAGFICVGNRVLMPSVRLKENEYFDAALRRFKRACEKAGILTELRRREYYEKPTQERKRKKAAAVKRHLKRVSREDSKRKRLY